MSQSKIVTNDLLLEFVEVALHNILYYRQLYPREIFVRKKIYSTAVHISEHPEVNEYLKNVLNSVKELVKIDAKSIRSVNVVFYNSSKMPIEKCVIKINDLSTELEDDTYFLLTEEALRTICLKLSMAGNYLKPLPEDSSFAIEIETYEAAQVALSENSKCENFPWIVCGASVIKNSQLLPVNRVNTNYLDLEVYTLENSEGK